MTGLGTRTLLLVRHGQYEPDGGGKLTEVGREQARLTGRWLASRSLVTERSPLAGGSAGSDPSALTLWSSTLPRAKETAELIRESYPRVKVRAAAVLREGMYTKVKGYDVPASERKEDRARAGEAFERFFRPSRADRLEIVVCHGNLIRYLVCRVLHVPIARWTRMNSHHCGVSRVLVRDTGAIRLVSYNETAHLPPELVT